MSEVTSAILMLYPPTDVLRQRVCEPLPFDERQQAFERVVAAQIGGGGDKVLEVDVYTAGFNHVDPERLERWFFELPWERLGSGTLSWNREGQIGAVGWTDGGERMSFDDVRKAIG